MSHRFWVIIYSESSIAQHTAFNPTDCLPNGLTGPGDPYSDFGPSSNSDLSNFRSSNHSGDHQFNQSAFGMNDDSMVHQLIPTPHNTIDENDEYFTVSGPIFLTVSKFSILDLHDGSSGQFSMDRPLLGLCSLEIFIFM